MSPVIGFLFAAFCFALLPLSHEVQGQMYEMQTDDEVCACFMSAITPMLPKMVPPKNEVQLTQEEENQMMEDMMNNVIKTLSNDEDFAPYFKELTEGCNEFAQELDQTSDKKIEAGKMCTMYNCMMLFGVCMDSKAPL